MKRDRQRRRAFRFIRRYMRTMQALYEEWAAKLRPTHPELRGPCSTCAFRRSTNAMPGHELTAARILQLTTGNAGDGSFHCHARVPRGPKGEYRTDGTVCAAWETLMCDTRAIIATAQAARRAADDEHHKRPQP